MGLKIVIDGIGPREGLLDRGGIGIQLNPAGKGGMAQFPAGSPAQASAGGQSPPVTELLVLVNKRPGGKGGFYRNYRDAT